jgi:hypothetical protein
MTDNNFRSVIPEVCANCEWLQENVPRYIYPSWRCEMVLQFTAAQWIGEDEKAYKTCDRFSTRRPVAIQNR